LSRFSFPDKSMGATQVTTEIPVIQAIHHCKAQRWLSHPMKSVLREHGLFCHCDSCLRQCSWANTSTRPLCQLPWGSPTGEKCEGQHTAHFPIGNSSPAGKSKELLLHHSMLPRAIDTYNMAPRASEDTLSITMSSSGSAIFQDVTTSSQSKGRLGKPQGRQYPAPIPHS
jgi:hypothetical protein